MTRMSDELKTALGILNQNPAADEMEDDSEPLPPAKLEVKVVESSVPDLALSDAKVDYVMARNLTYTLLDKVGDALAGALQVAQQSEHPRAYECVNQLATTMRGLTQDLIGFQKTFKEVVKGRTEFAPVEQGQQGEGGKTGIKSAADLLDLLERMEKEGNTT